MVFGRMAGSFSGFSLFGRKPEKAKITASGVPTAKDSGAPGDRSPGAH